MVYSFVAKTTGADVIKDVAPQRRRARRAFRRPDKFLHTDLEKILKDKGIKTVIAVGTSANGAVLYTGSARRAARHERDRAGRRHVVGQILIRSSRHGIGTCADGAGGIGDEGDADQAAT